MHVGTPENAVSTEVLNIATVIQNGTESVVRGYKMAEDVIVDVRQSGISLRQIARRVNVCHCVTSKLLKNIAKPAKSRSW